MKRTHSFTRKADVPVIDGRGVKACGKCQRWFSARPREQTCDNCIRPSDLLKRTLNDQAKVITPGLRVERKKPQVRGTEKTMWSDHLGLTLKCPDRVPPGQRTGWLLAWEAELIREFFPRWGRKLPRDYPNVS